MEEEEKFEEPEESEKEPEEESEEPEAEVEDEDDSQETFVGNAFEKLLEEIRALEAKVDAIGVTREAMAVDAGEVISESVADDEHDFVAKEDNPELDDLDLVSKRRFDD